MEREHTRVHEENKTEAGKVRWVRPDRLDNVGGPVGRRWGWPDEDGDGRMKMGTNPDRDPPLPEVVQQEGGHHVWEGPLDIQEQDRDNLPAVPCSLDYIYEQVE